MLPRPIDIRHAVSSAVIAAISVAPRSRETIPSGVVRKNIGMSTSAMTRSDVLARSQYNSSDTAGLRTAKATALYARSVVARLRQRRRTSAAAAKKRVRTELGMVPNSYPNTFFSEYTVRWIFGELLLYCSSVLRLEATPPKTAVAPQNERQVGLVVGPGRIFWKLQLRLHGFPAASFARLGPDGSGRILQEGKLILHILPGTEPAARSGMAWNQAIPVHREDSLDGFFSFHRVEVDHATSGHLPDGQQIHDKHETLFGQPHHQRAVGMVGSDISQFERRSAQYDGSLAIDGFVRQDGVRLVADLEALLCSSVCHNARAGLLECLATGYVIEVVVAVNQIADRLVGNLADFRQVLRATLRAAVTDRIRHDDTVVGDDEHRQAVGVAKGIDVLCSLDPGGLNCRRLCGGCRLALQPHTNGKDGTDRYREHDESTMHHLLQVHMMLACAGIVLLNCRSVPLPGGFPTWLHLKLSSRKACGWSR